MVEEIPSPNQVKHTAAIGTRYSEYESSSVRVFLAQLPAAAAKQLLEAGRITHWSGSRDGDSLEQLATIKDEGYAVNDGFTSAEEVGISAVVQDYRGEVMGCITLSAPRSRTGPERIAAHPERVIAAARSVSARLGYRPTTHPSAGN